MAVMLRFHLCRRVYMCSIALHLQRAALTYLNGCQSYVQGKINTDPCEFKTRDRRSARRRRSLHPFIYFFRFLRSLITWFT